MTANPTRVRRTLASLIALAVSGTALADFVADLDTLAGRKFSARLNAIDVIRSSGHPQALAVLQATLDGRLYRHKSDRLLVIAEACEPGSLRLTNAVTGDDLGTRRPGR